MAENYQPDLRGLQPANYTFNRPGEQPSELSQARCKTDLVRNHCSHVLAAATKQVLLRSMTSEAVCIHHGVELTRVVESLLRENGMTVENGLKLSHDGSIDGQEVETYSHAETIEGYYESHSEG